MNRESEPACVRVHCGPGSRKHSLQTVPVARALQVRGLQEMP